MCTDECACSGCISTEALQLLVLTICECLVSIVLRFEAKQNWEMKSNM